VTCDLPALSFADAQGVASRARFPLLRRSSAHKLLDMNPSDITEQDAVEAFIPYPDNPNNGGGYDDKGHLLEQDDSPDGDEDAAPTPDPKTVDVVMGNSGSESPYLEEVDQGQEEEDEEEQEEEDDEEQEEVNDGEEHEESRQDARPQR
ncbi:unnamed protein product, partial [Ectocarpus sp. 12 AP-2014]